MSEKRKPAQEDFNPDEYASKEDAFDPDVYLNEAAEISSPSTIVGGIGKVFSYPEKVTRGLVEKATGMAPNLTGKQILKGEAPSYSETFGLEPGLADFVLETSTDPLSMIGPIAKAIKHKGLLSSVLKEPSVLSPLAKGQEKIGKYVHGLGLRKYDALAGETKIPISNIAWEEGMWGGKQSIEKQLNDFMNNLLEKRNAVLKESKRSGVEISMEKALEPALHKVEALEKLGDPDSLAVSKVFRRRIEALKKLDPKEPTEYLRPLYQQGEFRRPLPGEKGYLPPVKGSLPAQATREGPTIILNKEQSSLPVGSKYIPSAEKSVPGVSSELPIGSQYVPETKIDDLISSKPPYIGAEAKKGLIIPEEYWQQKGVPYIADQPTKQIPSEYWQQEGLPYQKEVERTVPETYIQKPEVEAMFESEMPSQFYQKDPQMVLDITERKPGVDPYKATMIKTYQRKGIPQSKFNMAAQTTPGQDIIKSMSGGLEKEVERVVPGIDKEFNDKLASWLTIRKKLGQDIMRDEGKGLVGGLDLPIGVYSPEALAAKKAIEAAKSTPVLTGGGLLLKKSAPLTEYTLDPMIKRFLIEMMQDEPIRENQ